MFVKPASQRVKMVRTGLYPVGWMHRWVGKCYQRLTNPGGFDLVRNNTAPKPQ